MPLSELVAIGSSVVLYDLRTGDTVDYAISDAEAGSPIAAALLGRSPGDIVRVRLPRGRAREFEVLAIRAAAAA